MTEFKTGDRVSQGYEIEPGTVVGVFDSEVWVAWDRDPAVAYPYPLDALRLLPAPLPHLWVNVYGDDSIGISCESREEADRLADRLAARTKIAGRIGLIEVGDHLPGGVKLHDLRDGGK